MSSRNKDLRIVIGVVLFLLSFPLVVSAYIDPLKSIATDTQSGRQTPGGESKEKKQRFKDDELIVRFQKGIGKERQQAVHLKRGGTEIRRYRKLSDVAVVKVPKGKKLRDVLSGYRSDPDVLYVEPNYFFEVQITPNDTSFTSLWGLHNTGQTGGTADADINAPEAWNITTGNADTIVAVIDTGVDYNHQDLAANMWVNPGEIPGNGIDDDGNGYIDDVHGINAITGSGNPMDDNNHGTHVSGTIAAAGNNNLGVVGVNWNAKIIACKFLNSAGSGSTSDALECLDYLYDLKTRQNDPVDIILSNNSWGEGGYSQALRDAIYMHRQAGMLFVASAGNNGMDADLYEHYPSGYDLPNIISVAATDSTDSLAYFSNYGRRTVHVAAPGADILSTLPTNSYGTASGTSMAAPHVSGLAALLKSQDPSREWTTIRNLIFAGGQSVPMLAGKMFTSRRVRAADSSGVGSLTCVNQIVSGRLLPARDAINLGAGQPVDLAYLHINCGAPNGGVVVSASTGTQITLLDDGQGADQDADDGIYSGQWTPSGLGTYTLTFPTSDAVTVHVVSNYAPAEETAYSYRSITGAQVVFSSPTGTIGSPFPIHFAGASEGYSEIMVSLNGGNLSFTDPAVWDQENTALPTRHQTLVAPFWDELPLYLGGGIYWEVLGTTPNRELVVEWRNVTHYFYMSGTVTFQVVFFENSPDVLFNYSDVTFGNTLYDAGASATVGVQAAQNLAQQFSYETPSLRDGLALLWRLAGLTANAGPDQFVQPGSSVTLDGRGSSKGNSTSIAYSWTQTGGTPVVLVGADTATPGFSAPSTYETLTFQLTVTGDYSATSSDSVSVIVNEPPVAEAGPDQSVVAGMTAMLNGSASYDPNGTIASYSWTQTLGTTVTLTGDKTAAPNFTAPSAGGTLTFQLTVTDNSGQSVSDTVSILVKRPPAAEAGPSQWVLPGAIVALNGTGSSDPDGTIVSYAWTQAGGPAVTLSGADTATPVFTAPNQNIILLFTLTVMDNDGIYAMDFVYVTVNVPPVADAGPDQTVTASSRVLLSGTESYDPDGSIQAYSWLQIAGSSYVSLTGASTATPSFTAPATGGTLVFRLNARDNSGQQSQDTVTITISPTPTAVEVSPSSASPQIRGTIVQFTVLGSGGSGSYEYKVILQKDGNNLSVQDYSQSSSWTWNTRSYSAGQYSISAFARSVGSASPYEAQTTITYTLIDETTFLGIIRTFAGGGFGDEGQATSAIVPYPSGIALDTGGNVYITGNAQVRKVDAVTGIITVVAGTGTSGYAGDEGPATAARLVLPAGIAVDSSGNIYIADRYNHRVRKITKMTGMITTVAGNGTAGYSGDGDLSIYARLNYPSDVAVDGSNNLFIADKVNYRIRRVDAVTGIITTAAGNGTNGYAGDNGPAVSAKLASPSGVAVDSVGNIFVADTFNFRVRKIDGVSGIITTFAGNGTGGYSGDNGPALSASFGTIANVAIDAAGNVYINDSGNDVIRKVNSGTGMVTTIAGGGGYSSLGDNGPATSANLASPAGIALDGQGNFYIADYNHHRTRKVDAATNIITTIAGNGKYSHYSGDNIPATSATLNYPQGVAADAYDVYIADSYNYRIRKVDAATGTITTVAGNGSSGYAGDNGPATSASINRVSNIALDPSGNLYITDRYNGRIRMVNRVTGLITTVAGNGAVGFSGDNGVATSATLNYPSGVTVDAIGNIYIADYNNYRIRKVDKLTGTISTVAGNGTSAYSGDNGPATAAGMSPSHLALDAIGNIYITDVGRVRKIDPSTGLITTVAGNGNAVHSGDNGPATAAGFQSTNVALDETGNIYIADAASNRIRMVDKTTGIISTVAGNGTAAYAGDNGLAAYAALNRAAGIALDGTGNLYISDTNNNRIRVASRFDSTSAPFSFIDQIDSLLDTLITSNTITVTDIDIPVSIVATAGEYEINSSGLWLSTPSTVYNGDTVRVRVMSSSSYSTTSSATLSIGGVSAAFNVTTVDTPPISSVTLASDKASPSYPGAVITFTAEAAGGNMPEYKFRIRDNAVGTWTTVQNYSTVTTWSWTPSQLGSFDIQVMARNVGSGVAYQAVRNLTFSIAANSVASVTLTSDKPTLTIPGTVNFTATALGGNGNYEYKFRIKDNATGIWTTPRGYSPTSTWTWTANTTGSYDVQVQARIAGSGVTYQAFKNMTFTIVTSLIASVDLAADKTSPAQLGTVGTVTFTAQALGGSGNYEYKFRIRNKAVGTWTVPQNYSSTNTWVWTPSQPGNFDIQVWTRTAGTTVTYEKARTVSFTIN